MAQALVAESRSALDFLARAVAALEPLGEAAEIRFQFEQIRRELERDEVAIELLGRKKAQLIEALLGQPIFAPGAKLTVRARTGPELSYRARWQDARVQESPPPSWSLIESDIASMEREIAGLGEEARKLAESAQDAARFTAHARAQLAAAEARLRTTQSPGSDAPVGSAVPLASAPPRPGLFLRWWTRLLTLLLALFGRRVLPPSTTPTATAATTPATPIPTTPKPTAAPPRLPPIPRKRRSSGWVEPTTVGNRDDEPDDERRVGEEKQLVERAVEAEARLEQQLLEQKARLVMLNNHRDQRRRTLETQRSERRAALVAQLLEIAAPGGAAELELTAPEIPPGVLLLLSPGAQDSVDAMLSIGEVTNADRRPTAHIADMVSRGELCALLEQLKHMHPVATARRLAATMRVCRGHIADLDRRARQSHAERERELTASRVGESELRDPLQQAQAQLPREVERLLKEAKQRLAHLLDEVQRDWEDRINACMGMEQLRAEAAAIEEGSAHRLSIVCDEVRDSLTIESVRLILQLSHPVRQQLHRRRIQVVRETSPKIEETLDEVRVALPSALGGTFAALRLPEVTAVMSPQNFFSPLFRTLAREKKSCAARLQTHLDESRRAAATQLESGLSVEPLLMTTLERVVQELLAAHQRWIDALEEDERAEQKKAQQLLEPALALVSPLEKAAAALLTRVESFPT